MNTPLSHKRVSGGATDEHDGHLEESHHVVYTQRHATDDTACRLSDSQATEYLFSQPQDLSNTPNHPDSSAILGATENVTASLSEDEPATMPSQPPDSSTFPHTPLARRSRKRKPANNENSSAPPSPSTRSTKRLKVGGTSGPQRRPTTSSQEAGSPEDGEEAVVSQALRDFDVNSQPGSATPDVDETKENTPKGKGKGRASTPPEHDTKERLDDSSDVEDENGFTSITPVPGSPHDASSGAAADVGRRENSTPQPGRVVYTTRAYSHSEVYLTPGGGLAIDGGYSTESESSQDSNPENPSNGPPRSGRFRRNSKGVTEYISDWQGPSSQPSTSQPGQGDDDDEDQDSTECDYGSSPPEASQ